MYKPLKFSDYFIICSENYNQREIDPDEIQLAKYKKVPYYIHHHRFVAEYQVRYDGKRECIQVFFQQTKEKSDWLVNFSFPHRIYDSFFYKGKKIQLKAHGG